MLIHPGELQDRGHATRLEFIRSKAEELFDWLPVFANPFWDVEVYQPLSDCEVLLRSAIKKHCMKGDIVLTTPVHEPFFIEAGLTNIAIYDISPTQLAKHDPHHRMLWCDIYDSNARTALLEQVNPKLIYLSNILDYPPKGKKSILSLATC